MSHTEQELRALFRKTYGMPPGPAKFAALDEVVRHADALGLVELAFEVRMEATEVFTLSYAPTKALLSFSWCLAAYDREPDRFGGHVEHTLLWQYKWMVWIIGLFPEIPLERAHGMLDDMERRYRRGGHSLHAVLQHRGMFAENLGELDRAQELYERMARTRRDGLSDCSGCVPTSQVRTLVALGRDEEAIAVGEPARNAPCREQPQVIDSELLLPYVRTGRTDDAIAAHQRAYRRMRDNPHHLEHLPHHLLFCVHTGNAGYGLDLIERHFSWLERFTSPLTEMDFTAASVAVLDGLAAQGEGALPVRFPASEGRRRPDTTVAALAAELRARSLAIAERFDARGGNGFHSDRIRRWMAATVIGAPVALPGRKAAARSVTPPEAAL
ncbi:hypothetical protein ACIRPT_16655 [Streptomyces sp. NPDC101227]|uniref:hypothetical protein n=1 Tax=Streptomyces sp. NPDC101227 TaxID=3366136 RepID=UPI003829528F